jgi:hypothetical protein
MSAPLDRSLFETSRLAPHIRWKMQDPPESAVSHKLALRPIGQACTLRVVVAHRHLPATTLDGSAWGTYGHLMFGEAAVRLRGPDRMSAVLRLASHGLRARRRLRRR